MSEQLLADWLAKARLARSLGPDARWPAWSPGELLAVAIILNDTERLNAMQYTVAEALDRLRWDIKEPSVERAAAVFDRLRAQLEPTDTDGASVARTAPSPCIVCDRPLSPVGGAGSEQPDDAVMFFGYGQYSSTVFDPQDESRLEINVCDGCLGRTAVRQQHTNDSKLWAAMLGEVSRLFPQASVTERENTARRFIAIVRRERGENMTYGPGETIPAEVEAGYDLDGDRWTRDADGPWAMDGFDPENTEAAAGEPHDDISLLRNYGPITALPKRYSGPGGLGGF